MFRFDVHTAYVCRGPTSCIFHDFQQDAENVDEIELSTAIPRQIFRVLFAYLIAPCKIYQQTGAKKCGMIMDRYSMDSMATAAFLPREF